MKKNFTSKITSDDPILTAYVHGEIKSEEEYSRVEKALFRNPELRRVVEEIEVADKQLKEIFGAEDLPELPDSLLDKINNPAETKAAIKNNSSVKMGKLKWLYWGVPTAVAACLGLMFFTSNLSKVGYAPIDKANSMKESKPLNKLPTKDSEATASKSSLQNNNIARAGIVSKLENIESPVLRPRMEEGPAVDAMTSRDISSKNDKDSFEEVAPFVMESTEPPMSKSPENRRLSKEELIKRSSDLEHEVTYGRQIIAKKLEHISLRDQWNREGYDHIEENSFTSPQVEPLSTFSIDVDTASYANVRRFIEMGELPSPDVVRLEELVNYFAYGDLAPKDSSKHPLAFYTEAAPAPWNEDHKLLRIAMKAKEMEWDERPTSNLVFLIDVSGSMSSGNKLDLVKDSMKLLVNKLDERDRVAIVVYAGSSGLVLPSTPADQQEKIFSALNDLKSGGSTNGGEGISLAYKVAEEQFIKDGNNRIILCSDGDFNVGVSDRGQLTRLIQEKANKGIFLTVLGFGMGNYKDDMLETLSNKGNGNYSYIDSKKEARKVLVEEAMGTLLTVAEDVKALVEFNPSQVQAYRLLGYENRKLAAQDFNDDKKDASEVGAGHSVTAFYEVVPHGVEIDLPKIDKLSFTNTSKTNDSKEWLHVKVRYKQPGKDKSTRLDIGLEEKNIHKKVSEASEDFRFASSVVEFAMALRQSKYLAEGSLEKALERAKQSTGVDKGSHRHEFVMLVQQALNLSRDPDHKKE
ncbi:MAG: von Willebrand factor type A domain-containing protein [Verrucomicrobiota bacterium]